jgi:hypothetical protein
MNLTNTRLEIENKLQSRDFTSYALLVGYGENEWQYTSPDVNLDTNSMRCQNLEKKLRSTARDRAVHQMRIDIHRAIKKDLNL